MNPSAQRPGGARSSTDTELADIVDDWWSASLPAPVARDLLLAAIELFAERGYQATTTRDIVTRLGMSTGAMYAHFRSKEEMLFEVCLTGHRRVTAVLAEAAEAADDPADQLAGMVRVFTVCHARFHVIAKIVQYELYAMSEGHLAQVLDVRRRTSALMEDVLRRGVAAGEFTVPDVAGVGRALLSLCIDVARWYQPGHSSTPEELGELYAELAVRMVGTQPA